MTIYQRLGVIGGGAWGTALAAAACRAGREVCLWAREPEVVSAINERHENPAFLPGVPLDPALKATASLEQVARSQAILLVAPAQHLRAVTAGLGAFLAPGTPVIICAKGIELGTGALMSEAASASLAGVPQAGGAQSAISLSVLSGPTFAAEVARGLPAAVTLACADAEIGQRLMVSLGSRSFRPYYSEDVTGAQIGGAVKNVLAIACGILDGRKMGDNARAALITRGLAEMIRLGVSLGGRAETLSGLSGLGDLTLTCSSRQSRNMSLGAALGEGQSLVEYQKGRLSVAEGVPSSAAVMALARRQQVVMPICEAVDAILNHEADIGDTIAALLARPFREE